MGSSRDLIWQTVSEIDLKLAKMRSQAPAFWQAIGNMKSAVCQ